MRFRVLGRTGVRVSPICLGTANFADPTPEPEAHEIMLAALDAGINFFDTGNSYGGGESERFIGRTLRTLARRDEVVLMTKFHPPIGPGPNDQGSSRLHILRACEESLRRLQTDYIDVYLVHRDDPSVPLDETLGALDDLVRQGKVLYLGCSTHPAWRVMEALMVSRERRYTRYVVEQPPYNLLDRRIENELIPLCLRHGLALTTWSPIAMGILAGRYTDAQAFPADSRGALRGGIYAERINARGIEVAREFVTCAQEAGLSPAQLALLWVKEQPGITAPIFGPRSVEQLGHVLAIADMTLEPGIRERCDELVPPGSHVANFHNTSGWMLRH